MNLDEIVATLELHGWVPIAYSSLWVGMYRTPTGLVYLNRDRMDEVRHAAMWRPRRLHDGEELFKWPQWWQLPCVEDMYAFMVKENLL